MTDISTEDQEINSHSEENEELEENSTKLSPEISNPVTIPALDKSYKLGNLYTFCYINNIPLIVIGPHCKSIIN